MLSLHFLAAQDWERTWRYARMAARVAERHMLPVRRPFISNAPSHRLAGWATWTPMSWPRSTATSDDRSNCSANTTGRTTRTAMRWGHGGPIRRAEHRSPAAGRICGASSSGDPPLPSDSCEPQGPSSPSVSRMLRACVHCCSPKKPQSRQRQGRLAEGLGAPTRP